MEIQTEVLKDENGNPVLDKYGNIWCGLYIKEGEQNFGVLSCPFCGGIPRAAKRGNSVSYFIIACDICRAEVKGTYLVNALNSWNKRYGK